MQRRLEGFMSYLAEEHRDTITYDVILNKENPEQNDEILDVFFSEHPKATLGGVFNSRVYQVGNYLHKKERFDRIRPFEGQCGTAKVGRSHLSSRTTPWFTRLLRRKNTM